MPPPDLAHTLRLAHSHPELSVARILIVDDDQAERIALGAILERAGHEPFFAQDGEEALAEYCDKVIDVVITDLQMPGLHGLELIVMLRDLPAIIAISGTGESQLDMAQALGAAVTLTKPVDPDELLSAVTKAVAGKG